ncbi:COG4223 family protein [Tabrizicola aquatica]|uniref:COG4223 family protein n=1 Tax=Tabrizicola aquatica TaxID=909926 RepID=UPI000CD0086D|nr:hypothetical protein [Tabrizicola aquatica]
MARRKDPLTETQVEIPESPAPGSAAAQDGLASDALPPEPAPDAPPASPDGSAPLPTDALAAEIVPPSVPPRPPTPPRRRGLGIFGPLLGGALAAAGGFAVSHYNLLNLASPAPVVDLAPLAQADQDQAAALATLRGDLDALSTRLATLESTPAAQPDTARLDALDDRLAAIETLPQDGTASTAALASRLADLEQRLAAQPPAADQAEVDAALARLAEAEAAATRRAEEAAAAAAEATRAAGLDRLRDAVATGAGFQAELDALDDPDLTATLAPHAAGVPTLESLQSDFPEAARQALQLARASATEDGWGARLTDFFAAQTGARSLTPREGTDPDAILSRAEFALSEGRLADALAEVQALQDPIRAPFADWIARAQARLAVTAALEGN